MSKKNCFIVSVDGPSAAGKGTIAKKLAKKLGFSYLDTGLMYRILGFHAIRLGISFEDEDALLSLSKSLDYESYNQELSSEEVGNAASAVAQIGPIREVLNEFQKSFPIGKSGVVIDGRDIGSVVFPNADCKLYISASVEVRAKRRFEQAKRDMKNVTIESIKDQLQKRDERDMLRSVSPLVIPEGAFLIDTSSMTVEESCNLAYEKVLSCMENTH
jgi:cytidylate kinase